MGDIYIASQSLMYCDVIQCADTCFFATITTLLTILVFGHSSFMSDVNVALKEKGHISTALPTHLMFA